MESADFKDFWNKMDVPAHAHASAPWFDRYAQEILSFLPGVKVVADAGCGSGEILVRIAPHVKKIIGVDYSESMLKSASQRMQEGGFHHVELHCDNITHIDKYCTEPVDAVYSNGVIQYLSPRELDTFVSNCRKILAPGGKLVLLNIPNINSRMLFMLGFYKHERKVSFFQVLRGLPRLWLKIMRYKMGNRFKKYDDGIGNWFSIDEIHVAARKHGFQAQIYGASVVNYYYRFHAVFSIDKRL